MTRRFSYIISALSANRAMNCELTCIVMVTKENERKWTGIATHSFYYGHAEDSSALLTTLLCKSSFRTTSKWNCGINIRQQCFRPISYRVVQLSLILFNARVRATVRYERRSFFEFIWQLYFSATSSFFCYNVLLHLGTLTTLVLSARLYVECTLLLVHRYFWSRLYL